MDHVDHGLTDTASFINDATLITRTAFATSTYTVLIWKL